MNRAVFFVCTLMGLGMSASLQATSFNCSQVPLTCVVYFFYNQNPPPLFDPAQPRIGIDHVVCQSALGAAAGALPRDFILTTNGSSITLADKSTVSTNCNYRLQAGDVSHPSGLYTIINPRWSVAYSHLISPATPEDETEEEDKQPLSPPNSENYCYYTLDGTVTRPKLPDENSNENPSEEPLPSTFPIQLNLLYHQSFSPGDTDPYPYAPDKAEENWDEAVETSDTVHAHNYIQCTAASEKDCSFSAEPGPDDDSSGPGGDS